MQNHDLGVRLAGLAITLLAALASSACNPGEELRDSLRGRWEVVSYHCGAEVYTQASVPAPASITIAFAGASAEVVLSDAFCHAVERSVALYEDDSLLTLRTADVRCVPDPCTKLTGERCSARGAASASASEQSFSVRFTDAAATHAVFDFLDDCNGTGELRPAALKLNKR